MKFLLTSAGIKNTSIHNALVDLLGKPIAEASALCIPTAILPFPGGPSMAYRFISGLTANPMCELGWKSLGVLELTALPSIKKEYWIAAVQEAAPCWCKAAMSSICPAGCGSPDWRTSCRRCARQSMWG
jgi:dipeptidase E